MKLKVAFALLLVLLSRAAPASAQAGVSARLTAAQSELTIGDVTTLTLEVTHPSGWRVIAPELDTQWGPFEIRDFSLPKVGAAGSAETTTMTVDVALFEIGAFETPPLAVRVADTDGGITIVEAPSVTITVTPLRAPDDTELRDIKPQVAMPIPMVSPVVLAAVALVTIALAAFIRFIRRRAANQTPVDNRTPYQIAYDELVALDGRNLLQAGDFKQHYAAVAAILRRLFEEVYQFPATECTTTELRRVLRDLAASEEQAQFACALLLECDVVKFSDDPPMPEDAYSLSARARQLVVIMEPTLTLARSIQMESAA
ncbi:MAG: hypothetical protein DIU68_015145 [Chloroflexota bacterium]